MLPSCSKMSFFFIDFGLKQTDICSSSPSSKSENILSTFFKLSVIFIVCTMSLYNSD